MTELRKPRSEAKDFTSLRSRVNEGKSMPIFESEKTAHGKNIRRWCRFLLNGKKKCAIKTV
jgi:Fe-S-cluster containining protein